MLKVDLPSLNQDEFTITERNVNGERCFLVVPHPSFRAWNRQNLIFRSSLWNEDGYPVSLSFKKFFNWDERPELTHIPGSITGNGGVRILEKLDGSTLIVSKYKGELIVRSRGTANARDLSTGYEIDYLLAKYPKIAQVLGTVDTYDRSFLFEWLSPTNKIVIPHKEPDIKMLAVINHWDYSMATQFEVDAFASELGVLRPAYIQADSFAELIERVGKLQDFEGVCVYCNNDQDIRKIKSDWYLKMHYILTEEFSTFEKVVEFYFANGMPISYQEFFDIIANYCDHEVATQMRGDISRIIDAMKEVRVIKEKFEQFAFQLKASNIPRKQVAEKVFAAYGNTNRAAMIFHLYDGNPLSVDEWKKLFYQVIKK